MHPNPSYLRFVLVLVVAVLTPVASSADDRVRQETRVAETWDAYGLSGEGVIIAILDRGIDYEHPDFLNDDGTTRIRYILDLTDPTGAGDPENTAGVGTLYTRTEINRLLARGASPPTRDAVGHGTSTAGLAGGNGRASDGLYAGMAPEAEFIIVKFTTEGAPAHGTEPAEAPFYQPAHLATVLDFLIEKAEEAGMPFVALANFGSIQGPADGTSSHARIIDERFGPGHPGRVFVTGTSDDGGLPNHAGGTIGAGETIDLQIHKAHAGNLRMDLWYGDGDRFDVQIVTPSGTFGPYASPESNQQQNAQSGSGFAYYHNGSQVDFFGAESPKREIMIDFNGPTGDYVVRLTGASVTDGRFNAVLNPAIIFSHPDNRFESYVVPGHTVWDWATAEHNIAPNSYVLRATWTDVNGVERTDLGNEGGEGTLWRGSGIGPTFDGRYGVTVSAPGNSNIAAYSPRSYRSQFPHAHITEDGLYGIQSAVSGAAPVVTGIIALLLEADPTLNAAEVKDVLQRTARADAFTGEVPNTEWGYGKIDAFAAASEVVGGTNVERADAQPRTFVLEQNYPNPFNPSTQIHFSVAEPTAIRLAVFDVLGREVAVLANDVFAPGVHAVSFDAGRLPSGIYTYRMTANGASRSRVMTLLR